MSKNILVKLTKVGNRAKTFSISDNYGNTLKEEVSVDSLISGISITIEDNVTVIILTSISTGCCSTVLKIPIEAITVEEQAALKTVYSNNASIWSHLLDSTIYNTFYGCTHPYTIEYPYSYNYYDEIAQSVQDYSKVFTYLESSDWANKIQTNDRYFNKAVLYNDQQSSGILNLVSKPRNNLSSYLTYPIYNTDSKTITYTKSDNFYQFNTFWDIVNNKTLPLFTTSCTSLSYDKDVNQDNMIYTNQAYTKYKLRAKDLRVRLTLDDRIDTHIISNFTIQPAQISYK